VNTPRKFGHPRYTSSSEASLILSSRYLSGSVVESPVAVLLSEDGARQNVATVSFFSEVAHCPTTLWVSLAPETYTCDLVQTSGRFTLAVLHDGQSDLAWGCALSSGRDRDKMPLIHPHRGPLDFLYPGDSLAAAACQVRSWKPVGDHLLFVADIVAGELETRHSIRRALLTRDLVCYGKPQPSGTPKYRMSAA
jgi:flavin reductase (DIM6/NTAB) family NADH-FMN oxidoreductase RutF